MSMFDVALGGVLLTMLLVLIRAVKGPTVYDRLLAGNVFSTTTILLIAVAKYARFGQLARDDKRGPRP